MGFYVGPGTEQTLFFAAEQNEADGAARAQTGGFQGPGGFDYQSDVAAVVESAGAQVPGVQMRAKNYALVRLFVAANFGDDVLLVDWRADFIGHGKTCANFSGISEYGARKPESVFARDYGLGDFLQLAVADIGVAIQKEAFAGALPEDCGGSGFTSAFDDLRGAKIFVE